MDEVPKKMDYELIGEDDVVEQHEAGKEEEEE